MTQTSPPIRWIRLVPNILSAMRLGLAIAFPFLAPMWRLPVVILAGLSDFIDGYIARRFHASSWQGGLLDAVADKSFVIIALLTAVGADLLEPWQAGLLLSRDIAVALIALYAVAIRQFQAFQRMAARWFGKGATLGLFALLVAVYAIGPRTQPWQHMTLWTLFILAAALSIAAAVDYVIQTVQARLALHESR